MPSKKNLTLEQKANEVLKLAEKKGLTENYFFVTTFERYQFQLSILSKLQEEINDEGTMVEKEYVKGRKNLYTNPAISEYNKTSSSANNTMTTLLSIIKSLSPNEQEQGTDIKKVMKRLMKDD